MTNERRFQHSLDEVDRAIAETDRANLSVANTLKQFDKLVIAPAKEELCHGTDK